MAGGMFASLLKSVESYTSSFTFTQQVSKNADDLGVRYLTPRMIGLFFYFVLFVLLVRCFNKQKQPQSHNHNHTTTQPQPTSK